MAVFDIADALKAALEARFGEAPALPDELPGLATLTAIAGRASCRDYDPALLDPETVPMLAAVALAAPSKSDLQQADIIRVKDREKREAFADLVPTMGWVRDAPEFLVFCGNSRRLRQIAERQGKPFANDHLDAFFNAAIDAGIVMATFIHAAEAMGLGTCPISVIRNKIDEVDRLLELPDWVFPVAGLTLGRPAERPAISPRLPLAVTYHEDRFDETGAAEAIAEYDKRRRQTHPYRRQRLVDRYGEAADYGWMEEKARHYSVTERADFGAYIRKKRFNLD